MSKDLAKLEEKIGIKFQNSDFLKEALTHRSYLNENPSWPIRHNERLEYLGDAVLELVVTEELFNKYPDFEEGKLTLLRAALVNYQFLAKITEEFDLYKFIFLSRGEAKDSEKAREVILANAIESLIGAIYMDQGLQAARDFINKFITSKVSEVVKGGSYKDAKSLFQEIVQEKQKVTPIYKILEEYGPDHKKIFRSGVFVGEKKVAEGEGMSKQEAELNAAKNALENTK
ncbi:MAG: ribonuclease III [Candidatus Liptonbacteria bacterium]|nr:ribonuclease III [Candidatus Liptonbacteria bacterium]